jgi:hypothetical protein
LKTLHYAGGSVRFPFLLPATGKVRTTILLVLRPFSEADRVVLAGHIENGRREKRATVRQLVRFVRLASRPRHPEPPAAA